MNTLLKEYKNKKIERIYYSKINWYNTNYDLLDNNNNLIMQDRNTTCFKKIFLKEYNHSNSLKFNEGLKLRIYALSQDTVLSEEEIKEYVKLLRSIKIPFNFKIYDNLDLNYEIKINAPTICCFDNQKVYVFEIKLDNINFTQLKYLVYHIRFIYEMDNDKIIKESLEYKKKNKNYNIFQIISVLRMKYIIRNNYQTGHSVCGKRYPFKFTIKKIKELLKQDLGLERTFFKELKCFCFYYKYNENYRELPTIKDNESINDFYKKLEKNRNIIVYGT